ncbi:MAG: nicotinic acid mononucleotide adenylyltransferase, partial [Gammaproteobacteria bacterium]|nr:nicotinic acid mononucleotide adenylyltransferase [Gammaproteobacteria bacterium]
MKPIGILGGTFDPVHHGHLRLAMECYERLDLAEVRLMPLHTPPHRHLPHASPGQRLAMLEIAIEGIPGLIIDDCELNKNDVTYTIDTLSATRDWVGNRPVCLLLGLDAFNTLHTWRRWKSLLDYSHIVIADRPDNTGKQNIPELNALLNTHSVSDIESLHKTPAGKIHKLIVP